MTKWTINSKRTVYAVFRYYGDKLILQNQSSLASKEDLKNILLKKIWIFDPRKTQMREVGIEDLKDQYEADIFL